MGAGPIEDAATQAVKNGDAGPKAVAMEGSPPPPQSSNERFFGVDPNTNPFLPGTQNYDRWASGVRDFPMETESTPVSTPEEEIIKAQHLFIEGLLNFLHDQTKVSQFAGEQESYIRASMKYTQAKLDQK